MKVQAAVTYEKGAPSGFPINIPQHIRKEDK